MKRIFLLLSIIVLLMSCNTDKTPEYALVSGKIMNPLSDEVSITNNKGEKVLVAKLAEDGTFKDTIHKADGFYDFKAGNEVTRMYLKNGYDVNITLDTKEFDETVTYTGKGEEANNYQAQMYLLNEKNTGNPQELYVLEEADFLSKSEAGFKALNELADAIKDKSFAKIAKENLTLSRAFQLLQYEPYHQFLTKNNDFKVSADFPDPYENLDLTDEELYKNNRVFVMIVHRKFIDEIMKETGTDRDAYIKASLEKLKTMPGGVIRDGLASDLFSYKEIYNKENADMVKEALALIQNEETKQELITEVATMSKVAKGNKSPEFVNYENYKGGTTSLSDLKGKYVYIDVWATWCGPCKAEIPHLIKLEKQYHGKNITFVSISVDRKKDKDKWRAMIAEKNMVGVQLFADKDWKSDFVVNYGIKGIPAFILIDPDGNIVSSSAPRPSDPRIIELFKSLNI